MSIFTGTSSAAPFVSGATALLMSALGKSNVDAYAARDLLGSTAKPVDLPAFGSTAAGTLDSVVKQGAGLVDVYHALHSKTRVAPARLFLNDTKHANLKRTIEVTNTGSTPQTYTFSHKAAGTLLSLNSTSRFFNHFPVPTDPQRRAASVTYSPTSLTVQPGAKGTFTASIQPPTIESSLLPIYSGWLGIDCAEDPALGSSIIPYFGVVGDMSAEPVLDLYPGMGEETQGVRFPVLFDQQNRPIYNDSTVWTLQTGSDGVASAPQIVWRTRLGGYYSRVDLVHANTTVKPTVPISDPKAAAAAVARRSFIRGGNAPFLHDRPESETGLGKRAAGAGSFAAVDTLGKVCERSLIRRTSWFHDWIGCYSDPFVLVGPEQKQVTVVDGDYKYLLRVAKLFQEDYSSEDSYESYLSRAFTVKGSGNSSSK